MGTHKVNLRVVVKQKSFNNQDVGLLFRVGHVSFGRQWDSVGAGELHWVFNPTSNCVGHGLHIQSWDHCRATWGDEGKKPKHLISDFFFLLLFLWIYVCTVLVNNIFLFLLWSITSNSVVCSVFNWDIVTKQFPSWIKACLNWAEMCVICLIAELITLSFDVANWMQCWMDKVCDNVGVKQLGHWQSSVKSYHPIA